MSRSIPVRLSKALAQWLAETAARAGVPPNRLVLGQSEKARSADSLRPCMRLTGWLNGLPRDLSLRPGYAAPTNR
jgi:hypothetical protein